MTRNQVTATAFAALALAVGSGLAAAPAQATPLSMTNNLTIDPLGNPAFIFRVGVRGVVAMSKAAAQDAINHGHTIALRIWGDDPNSDDLLYGPVAAPMFAATDGLH